MNLCRGSRASLELVDYMCMLEKADVDKPHFIGSRCKSILLVCDMPLKRRCFLPAPLYVGRGAARHAAGVCRRLRRLLIKNMGMDIRMILPLYPVRLSEE